MGLKVQELLYSTANNKKKIYIYSQQILKEIYSYVFLT